MHEMTLTLTEKMEMVRMAVRAVTRNYKMSRLICGDPGIGKSYTVISELIEEKANYVHVTGGVKDEEALYVLLHQHNEQNKIIVFDDVNDILKKKNSIEILRIAVSNEEERKITYMKNPYKLIVKGTKVYKPTMTFVGKILIITNIPKKKIDTSLISRMSPIEVKTTKNEIFEYIKLNLENAPPRHVPLAWKQEVVNFIENDIKLKNVKHIDFRLFEDCMLWKAATVSNKHQLDMWKKYVYTILVQ